MSREAMLATVLATNIAECVAKDMEPEAGGCDVSAGLYGPHLSQFIRETAALLAEAPRFRQAVRAAAVRAGLLHVASTPLTDDQLITLLQNVADVAHYAKSHRS